MLIFRGNTDWHLVSNNKQYSLSCIFGSLYFYPEREIFIFSSSSSPRIPDSNIVRLCCLEKVDRYKHPPRKLYKDMVCNSFLIYVVGRLFGVFLFTLSVSLF